MILAERRLKGGIQIVQGLVIEGRAWPCQVEFPECVADDFGQSGIILRPDRSDVKAVHVAKVGKRVGSAEEGHDTIENGDGDDKDADKRLVCGFHNEYLIFQGWLQLELQGDNEPFRGLSMHVRKGFRPDGRQGAIEAGRHDDQRSE